MSSIALELQTKIEKYIADFIAAKGKLLDLQKSGILTVRDKAKELFVKHQALDAELMEVLPKVKEMKDTGKIDPKLIFRATNLLGKVELQMMDVRKLLKENGKDGGSGFWTLTNVTAAVTVVALLAFAFWPKDRKAVR